MATYRLCYKKGKKGYAKNHAAYILREENYKGKEDLVYKESGNIPFTDGSNAIKFWEYADVFERADSVAYREMELNIPNELNHNQAKELIQNFVKKEFSTIFPYTFAIHESHNKEGEKNLHCHLMFSERELDGIQREDKVFFKRANAKNPQHSGAKKNRIWQTKDKLLALRKSWEIEQNLALEKYGFETRVDCRSLRDIREEALEQGNFKKAEELDRTPINISGKILYKVDHKIKLSKEEEKKYQIFLQAKEEKKIKERSIEILPKEEMMEYIHYIKTYNIEDNALNICTKGAYFRMKRTKNQVKKEFTKYPNSIELQNHYETISNDIAKMEKQWKNSLKFKNISEQLERNHKRELEKASTLFITKFGENYQEVKEKLNQEKFLENLEKKYQHYGILKLKIKASMLAVENTEYKAVNILSQYQYDKKLQEFSRNIAIISELEEKKQEAQFYHPKEVSVLDAKLFYYSKKQQEITKELVEQNEKIKQNEKFISFSERILEKNRREQSFLEHKIEKQLNNSNYYKEKIQLMNRYSFLEKLYERYSRENTEPKRLYSIALEKEAIDVLFQTKYQKEAIPNSKEALEILSPLKAEIQKKQDQIKNHEKIEKLFHNILESSYKGMTGTEVLAMNKLSKGQYSKNYKLQRELKKNIITHSRDLQKMGIFSRGKNHLQEKIIQEERLLNQYQREEERLYLRYRTDPKLKQEAQKIEKSCKMAIEKTQKELIIIKTEQKINYQLKRTLEKAPEKARQLPKQEYSKHTRKAEKFQREIKGNLPRVLQHARYELDKILAADKTEIQSTIDIVLKKEKGYEWEL